MYKPEEVKLEHQVERRISDDERIQELRKVVQAAQAEIEAREDVIMAEEKERLGITEVTGYENLFFEARHGIL